MNIKSVNIPGYQITEEIFRSDRTVIYRAIPEKDQSTARPDSVIIKTLSSQYPTIQDITRLKHEFHIIQKMQGDQGSLPHVIRVYEQVKYENSLALILEDFQGKTLDKIQGKKEPMNLKLFLQLAINISKGLGQIHSRNIIHKDISPSNILISPDLRKVQIIDFDIASELSREKPNINVANHLEGSLAYISPEQTGRMNRDLDYRTDYYSLAIMFYEMLTSSLPFEAEDPVGWVHSHIAKTPSSIQELNPSIPKVLSEIVVKLLSKNAQDRYQSSIGIISDLETCLRNLSKNSEIPYFKIGTKDVCEQFQISQTLFGREKEVQSLLHSFKKVSQGACEYLLVSGNAGVGKSALINEIHRSTVKQRGYFIEGKFDQFQKDIPYSALNQAFEKLITQLLSGTDEELENWKDKIVEAVQPNGQLIIDIIPKLEKLIGPQPSVQQLNPTEAQNRLLYTFQRFFKVFAKKEYPLVLFLDDLQWTDIPTLKLIEHLAASKDTPYLLLIGAFRGNQVVHGHPLLNSIEAIEKVTQLHQLHLQPLETKYINLLIAETLHNNIESTADLADLVHNKTNGNPFFVGELLKMLYQQGVFNFDSTRGRWHWDLEEVAKIEVTDNVVTLMIGQLEKLPQETTKLLQSAACIGTSFHLNTLSIVDQHSSVEVSELLLPAIKKGIIHLLNNQYRLVHLQDKTEEIADFDIRYRFQHDKVQQAAYSMLNENEKQLLHLNIGHLLLRQAEETSLVQEQVIKIVQHFNLAKNLVTKTQEKEKLGQLNFEAGKKAKRSSAYQAAFEYFGMTKSLLPENSWKKNYTFCFKVHQEYAETAYLSGELDVADDIIKIILNEAKTKFEKTQTHYIQIKQLILLGKSEEAITVGIEALSLLGIKMNIKPSLFSVLKELALVKWKLSRRSVESLIELPLMKNSEKRMVMRIMIELSSPAYDFGSKNLFALLILKQVNLALRIGNSPEAAYAYAVYALLLNGVFGDLKTSYKFGQLALKLNEKMNDLEFKCRINVIYVCFIHYWNHHWKTALPFYKKALEAGLQSGDLIYTGFTAYMMPKWTPSSTLKEAIHLGERNLKIIIASKYKDSIDLGNILQHYRLNLMNLTKDRFTLSDSIFDEDECLNSMRQNNFFGGIAFLVIAKLKLYYLYEAFEMGIKLIPKGDEVIETIMGMPFKMEFCFYVFMTYSSNYLSMNKKEQRGALKRMKKEYKQMKKWHDHYPINSEHLILLMDGEFARVKQQSHKAISFIEKAITVATAYGDLQYQSLANKLLGKLYISLRKERIARLYLSDAYYNYQVWGAYGLLKFFEEHYSNYIPQGVVQPPLTSSLIQTKSFKPTNAVGIDVDMSTVIKAAQTLSREVELKKLLKKLIEIAKENAGAEKAVLLLYDENQRDFLIQAESIEAEAIEAKTRLEDSTNISRGIVKYVTRSWENIILGNAAQEGSFINDPDIKRYQPKSVLCMPMINKGNMIGILYLENNVTAHAFTQDHLEVLNILTTQAAISIDNAFLYENLEEKVKARTKELNVSNTELEKLNESQSNWFNNIAHELRTPLTLITGPVGHLIDRIRPKLNGDELEDIFLIEKNGNRLIKLVNEILDISKLESGELSMNIQTTDMGKIIHSVMTTFRSEARQKRILLETDSNQELFLNVDEQKIYTVITNLVSNAIKFTHQGGKITLGLIASESSSNLETDGPPILLTVEDNGAGIANEDLPFLFDRYYQASNQGSNSSSKTQGGTGIGLALSKEMIKLHGGQIQVKSELGKGSTFSILLPASLRVEKPDSVLPIESDDMLDTSKEQEIMDTPYTDTETADIESVPYPQPSSNGRPFQILLVEDNTDMLQYTNKILSTDYKLIEAIDGQAALELLAGYDNEENKQFQPDLIISDIMMPRMDGLTFAQNLKKMESYARTPFIFLTARTSEEDKLLGLRIGVDDYITKPFKKDELLARIENLLANATYRKEAIHEEVSQLAKIEDTQELPPSYADELLNNLQQEVENRINDSLLSVESLADAVGMHKKTLTRMLKKTSGLTPGKLIRDLRLQRALRHLEARTYMTINEVAYAVGFESPSNFSQAFNKRYGKKPSEYLQ